MKIQKISQRPSSHVVILAFILLIGLLIRAILYFDFPIFLTADSWEYLSISEAISQRLDFFSQGMGDWRLPIYPLFLALLRFVTDFDSSSIVLAQKALGLSCVVWGFLIGYLSRSRLTAVGLALFMAVNPVFLLNEHLVMTESLFLFTMLGFTAVVLYSFQRQLNVTTGLLVGLAFSFCVLTRGNGLFFCASLLGLLVLARLRLLGHFLSSSGSLPFFISGIALGTLVTFGPWLWRNFSAFGQFSPLTHNTNLNLLLYLYEHDLIDPSLPTFQKYGNAFDPERPQTIYNLIWLSRANIVEGEQRARLLVREQVIHQPLRYGQEVVFSLQHLAGYPVPGVKANRGSVDQWFKHLVSDVTKVHDLNNNWYTAAEGAYIASRIGSPLTDAWATFGSFYLFPLRLILTGLLATSLALYAALWRSITPNFTRVFIVSFSLAYFLTLAAHAITLSDYDRFVVPFDWIPVLLICLMVSECARHFRIRLDQHVPTVAQGLRMTGK